MSGERLERGLRAATETRSVVIGAGALERVGESFSSLSGPAAAVIVADETTYQLAGRAAERTFARSGIGVLGTYVFPARPALHADYRPLGELKAWLSAHDASPVAVGSGTINDLVKRASAELDRTYLCVGTAASMDGYSAFGAAITRDGYKQTLSCPAPRGVVLDLDVLSGAPAAMTASGYADLLGKVPAGADWLLADALGVEPLDPAVWDLVQGGLAASVGHPAELHGGDAGALRALVEGLVISGLAMQAHRSSRPASGAEHQFSHLWEMEGLGQDQERPLSHGFKVGVGTVAIAGLYEELLARDLRAIDVEALVARYPSWAETEATVRGADFPAPLTDAAVEQTRAKYASPTELRARLTRLRAVWPELRRRLRTQLRPARELAAMLAAAGCPASPEEIGVDRQRLLTTFPRARLIRKRYTVLDLAFETGVLEELVAASTRS